MKVRDVIKGWSLRAGGSSGKRAPTVSIATRTTWDGHGGWQVSAEVPKPTLAADWTAGTVTEMTEYGVVIEQDGDAWGAYVPDLPGCVAAGVSREEVTELIAVAIPRHVASLRAHGEAVPTPTATGTTKVQVA